MRIRVERAASLLLCVAVCAALAPVVARGQASPRELRQSANTKLAQGAFVDAVPDLEQLIAYLGQSKDARIVASMESVFYNLAICHFFSGQFDPAETAFRDYVKRYPYGSRTKKAHVYIADALRFKGSLKEALKAYEDVLRKYGLEFSKDLKADIYCSMARCYLADDDWKAAIEPLMNAYVNAPDFMRRNWAATLLTTAYFKELDLEKVYPLVQYFLRPDSFASRSIAFNLAALEAGDELFADEQYRDALWVHRMVYPYDMVLLRSEQHLAYLQKLADDMKGRIGDPRELMRVQESIGELEEELKALRGVPNYDMELYTRIARGYMEMLRYWEAREIFLHLHEVADPKLAEEALYFAFICSTRLLPWDRAYAIGEDYMRVYPAGMYYDPITLAMGQMYAKEQNWKKVIEHFKKVLEVSPKHESAAEVYFLVGYASFMEEQFAQAIDYFTRLIKQFPGHEFVGAATYWTGMSHLFDGKYEEASPYFDRVLQDFASGPYTEDASFRRAVCDYGQSRYEEADRLLASFVAAYPKSVLYPEAIMMRADVAGSGGRLDDAVRLYKQAMAAKDFNIEFYNHCAFQCGRILTDNEDWPGAVSHYRQYIENGRDGSNLPLAVYWIGVALWNSGEEEGAMRYYREAVEKHGKDINAMGIDLILDEWVGRTKRAKPEEAAKAWQELVSSLTRAMQNGDKVMELRLKRVLVYHPNMQAGEKEKIIAGLLDEANLPHSSPSVLQSMLDYARERKNQEFAVRVAQDIIDRYTETDYALDSRMVLADVAIARARNSSDPEQKKTFYAEAIRHLDVIRAVFASSGEAAQALMLLGSIYQDQQQYEKADECYKAVLGVKGWRNLWAEAGFGRGEAAYAQRQYEAAGAHYQHVYVMYGHYRLWAARAYLKHAETLRRLYQTGKAVAVLEEMLADPELAALPEGAIARDLLGRLKGQGG